MRARPLKLSMFALLTKKNAASRVFCYQLVPHLQSIGIQVRVFPPSPVRIFELLCESVRVPVLRTALKIAYWYGVVPPIRLLQIAWSARSDIVFIQRGMWRYDSPPLLERLVAFAMRRHGGHVVYQYDDALYLHADPAHYQQRFRLADLVITGNANLAEYARRWNRSVVLWDAPVDIDYFRPARRKVRDRVVTIGWAGTDPQPARNLTAVVTRLRRRFDVRFRLVGPPHGGPAFGAGVDYVDWTAVDEVRNLQSFDIGVMPLADTEYDRSKEGYKLKQYMAVGIPVVASPIGKNLEIICHGVTGFLAETPTEWEDALARLIEDDDLRQRMGEAGRRLVEERYSIPVQAPRLVEILRDVAIAVSPNKGSGRRRRALSMKKGRR
jgi:glycosyltransferase involved in cell wall biosynthesis